MIDAKGGLDMVKPCSAEFLFMAEAEGETCLVDTREARINALTNYVRAYPEDVMPEEVFWRAARRFELSDLSPQEIRRILASIR